MEYDQYQVLALYAQFADPSTGEPVDPGEVWVYTKDPDGVVASKQYGVDPEVVRLGTGSYRYDFELAKAGTWWWGWKSAGAGQAAAQGTVRVRQWEFG